MNEERFWVIICSVFCGMIVAIALIVSLYYANLNKMYIENGFTQQQRIGATDIIWVKEKANEKT